ncbi:ataxin-2 [Plakobranchus ocellatus]|uniref:Ataxin-2 n=1 Tax=Plakobranchus ocellatus TaxID=259542 RepID=A0AAV4A0N4_9GAST|nr:ataxin-2 [Plakobranchus ocellatus]
MSASIQNPRQRKNNRQHNTSNRGGYQNTNSYRRETPEPEAPSGVYTDPRTAAMMCSIIGTQSTVKTVNGKTYKGRTTAFSDKGDIAMADAKLENEDGTPGPNLSGIVIPRDSFVVCRTNGVDLRGICSSSDFTDAGIVARMNGNVESQLRELQPFYDDEAGETSTNLSLDDNTGGWDAESMFQENHQKFDLKTSFDANMPEYTTRLPEPGSEAYEAKERFAKEKAEEIERDELYQRRIAKEIVDNEDEDTRFSFVHRDDSHSPHRSYESSSSKNSSSVYASRQSFPSSRGDRDRDRDDHLRNGNMHRGQGRGSLQRQNSPYSGGHIQHPHHPVHNARQPVNNHYQHGPPPSGPLNARNQGHGPNHLRQQQPPPPHQGPSSSSQNHSAQSAPHHHYSNQQHISQQPPSQHRIPQHQQVVSPTQPPPGKPPHHLSSQSVPSSSPLSSSPSPVQSHQPPSLQKSSSQQQQLLNLKAAPSSTQNGNSVSSHQLRQQGPPQLNGADPVQSKVEPKSPNGQASEVTSSLSTSSSVSAGVQHQQHQHPPSVTSSTPPVVLPSSNVSPQQKSPPADVPPSVPSVSPGQPTPSKPAPSPPVSSSSSAVALPGRAGRSSETNPEEARSKIADLQDFKEKFVLEPPPRQEESVESVTPQAALASVVTQPPVSQASSSPDPATSVVPQPASTEQSSAESSSAEKKEEEPVSAAKLSKLNPNAKEFKPKAPVEAQSPSPQPRSSPHVHQIVPYPHSSIIMQFPPATYPIMHQNPQRKRAALQANVDHLTHQVTGQPLLATQPPMTPMMYVPGASLPAGYQIMGRMPNSLTMAQGQHAGLEQAGAQSQHQPVFAFQLPLDLNPSAHVEGAVPAHAQQQPIPAHLPHPQPAHAGPLPQPPVQQAQPAHVPNPAPSPVHQQQHPQHNGQPGIQQQSQHHQMSQGPPQSVTPQPAHYMNFSQHGVPRTSLAGTAGGQQSLSGHPSAVSISYMSAAPQYPGYQTTSNGAQYSFAPAAAAPAQPQTSQNSSHGQGGSHPQYVVMPQTAPQGHPPMQQHSGQAYPASGLQFHPQHNLMQGPPQMPPNHGHNPNQGGPHLLQHGMPAGLHQQVAGSQPGMYMPMPSTQLFQHQQ